MSLVSLAKNPVPSGATVGTLTVNDGTNLRYATWEATRAPLRGTVIVVPGRTEYIEKYFEVVADLRRRGYAVCIFDLRGQGGSDRALSDRRKGHVRNFSDYDDDLEAVLQEIVLPHMPGPYVGLGHSLGGHILIRRALERAAPLDRMVVTAPMIAIAEHQIKMPLSVARSLAEGMSWTGAGSIYVPGGNAEPSEFGDFETNELTHDRERFARARAVIEAAPELALGSPTVTWMRAAFQSMAMLATPDAPLRVKVPMLFVTAGEDKVVSTMAIEDFALRTKLGSRVLIGASRHEILMETDDIRSRFWAAFDAYLSVNAEAA